MFTTLSHFILTKLTLQMTKLRLKEAKVTRPRLHEQEVAQLGFELRSECSQILLGSTTE